MLLRSALVCPSATQEERGQAAAARSAVWFWGSLSWLDTGLLQEVSGLALRGGQGGLGATHSKNQELQELEKTTSTEIDSTYNQNSL